MKPLISALAISSCSLGSALFVPAVAQSEQPTVKTEPTGTTIIGDRESPIGLYITPWRNAAPESELDRPARFLEEQLLPIDADVFRRQIEYYNTISDHLRLRGSSKPTVK